MEDLYSLRRVVCDIKQNVCDGVNSTGIRVVEVGGFILLDDLLSSFFSFSKCRHSQKVVRRAGQPASALSLDDTANLRMRRHSGLTRLNRSFAISERWS